jgi:hypothetical protein
MAKKFKGYTKGPYLYTKLDLKYAKKSAQKRGYSVRSKKESAGTFGSGIWSGPLFRLYTKEK